MTRLRKLDSIVVNKVIVGLHIVQFGKVVCVAFSDGTVEYRERSTMNEIYNEANPEKIMNLSQVGFTFTEDSPCKSPHRLLAVHPCARR
jgi:mediator of RNA polymerase II transcription subunit 16, fungi type